MANFMKGPMKGRVLGHASAVFLNTKELPFHTAKESSFSDVLVSLGSSSILKTQVLYKSCHRIQLLPDLL